LPPAPFSCPQSLHYTSLNPSASTQLSSASFTSLIPNVPQNCVRRFQASLSPVSHRAKPSSQLVRESNTNQTVYVFIQSFYPTPPYSLSKPIQLLLYELYQLFSNIFKVARISCSFLIFSGKKNLRKIANILTI
jgi:hypothetical protein